MSIASAPPTIGVLALQGDFAAHGRAIRELGGRATAVRRGEELEQVDALILPGGESTALLRLLHDRGMDEAIRRFATGGGPLFGTCAGLILLASEVRGPGQESLGLIDVSVERNAYGRQVDSFVAHGTVRFDGEPPRDQEMVFIRAPRIVRMGTAVERLGERNGEATLVREGRVWASTFHPELSRSREIHRRFLEEAHGAR